MYQNVPKSTIKKVVLFFLFFFESNLKNKIMKLYNAIGTTTPVLRVTKNSGNLLIIGDSSVLKARLTAVIERSNGENITICQNVKVLDYAILNNMGADASYKDSGTKNYVELNLGADGNLVIQNGDQLAINLTGLSSTTETIIHVMDETTSGTSYNKHEVKIMPREQQRQVFDTLGGEFVYIPNIGQSVDTIILNTPKGRLEYSIDEALYMTMQALQFVTVTDGGLEALPANDVILCTMGVTSFELIRKYDVTAEPIYINYQYDANYITSVNRAGGRTGIDAAKFRVIK